ncbi:cardiolipin synthase [Dokdonella sp.]|uniref:cardiolipin synthase n=1 Tax=Dokdonella sp. TaxID=2291710 RepID=UPI0031CBD033|nr:cardiolipin synthase [Dokdonella sp.]
MTTTLLASLAVLLHVGGMLAALHALMRTRTAPGAVAWVLGLLLLPYVTLLPYLFLGRRHFRGHVAVPAARLPSGQAKAPTDAGADAACARHAAIASLLGTRFHAGQALQLLIGGEATFAAIFAAMAQAEHSVLVQFFVIHDDQIGRRMQRALLDCAARGVAVCVLYDGVGSHDLPRAWVATLRAGGVAVHPFATRNWSNRLQVNFRNHRKIVVVDGRQGFVGGLNVGDEYLGRKPPLAPWRDTHLALQGPAVADLEQAFAGDWRWITGADPPLRGGAAACGPVHTLIAATGPADDQESCSLLFVALINGARHRLWLTTPYFVPDHAVGAALRLAVLRGVDVRILLPARPDHRTVFLSSSLHAWVALRAGVRVFRYQPGFMHQKVVLVDDDTAVVGSMNLDSRSLRLNFEVAAVNVDPHFAAAVQAMLQADFAQAREIDQREYLAAPLPQRVLMHVARLFDPLL